MYATSAEALASPFSPPPSSPPIDEQHIRTIQALAQGRLASGHVASKFHLVNRSDFEEATRQLTGWAIRNEDRAQAVQDLFESEQLRRRNRNFSPTFFRPNTSLGPFMARVWTLASSTGIEVCVKNSREPQQGSYKKIDFFHKLNCNGSSLRPFQNPEVSDAVQLRPRDPSVAITMCNSIRHHRKLWDELQKSHPPGVYLPRPPELFSEEEKIFFQPAYKVLESSVRRKELSLHDLLTALLHVGNTLEWMRSLGYLHNDVKPDNVLWEPNPHIDQDPHTRLLGMLNDFDFARFSRWGCSQPFYPRYIVSQIPDRLNLNYGPLCDVLCIATPLGDWCNFAQMVGVMIGVFSDDDYCKMRNVITKDVLMSCGNTRPDIVPEDATSSSIDKLKLFFQNAYKALCYENALFFLTLIGERNTDRIKQVIETKQRSLFPLNNPREIIVYALQQVFPNIPEENLNDTAVRAAFSNVTTPYTLQNMVAKLRSALEELRANEQRH